MKRLLGTFSVDLPCRIYVSGPKEQGFKEYSFEARVDDLDVAISLPPNTTLNREDGDQIIWSASNATVVVDGRCGETPPQRPSSPSTDDDQKAIEYHNFFMSKLERYSLAGARGLNRLLRFFRFRLRNNHATMVYTSAFLDVQWSDESGKTYPFELQYVKPTPDIFYLWQNDCMLTPERFPELRAYLATDVYPELHLELLIDAWTAIEHKNERRAVIEGATACETAVKVTFFGCDTVAADAFEYLEEKTRARLPVTQYLHSAAKRVFGRSFKEENPEEYTCIENLFSARNKAAHRGLCYYRDPSGSVHLVDDLIVGKWLKAVDAVFQWLEDVSVSLERERSQY